MKFDAASLIAKLYQEQNQSVMAKQVLRKALQLSQHNVYWHCRLLFQLAVRINLVHFNRFNDFEPIYSFAWNIFSAITCQ